jgi:acyl transferase domain-containing protein
VSSGADPGDDAQSIAIIGLSGRFPKSSTVEALWQNVAAGRELVTRFSDEELAREGVPEALRRSPDYVPARAVLDDAFLFDAGFFGFTPGEAKLTDPQHRLFLECAWEALEHAGYDPSRYPDYIGVYGGADVNAYAVANLALSGSELWGLIGNDKDYFATRVSYKLNLRGPGITVQTACSTSLVAVQVACQALLGYQCDMALAGGAGIAVPEKTGYLYHKGGILSPDGCCRSFDAAARGTFGGNGVGVVLLKRLKDALADGDPIHAVIKGAAINNDGSGKVGYTAPSVEGQAEVIATALAMAGVSPDTIGLVEAHGTATELGDPVEIAALTDAYRSGTERTGYCAIGSLKSNLGHMNSAAGVGGLLKAVMALEHRQIPPSLHFETPNPNLDLAASPFYVSTALAPWPEGPHPRRAAVSSFGVGGTNAHAILEEAPPVASSEPGRAAQLLVLSAKSEAALTAAAQRLADHLGAHPEVDLADVAYTLQVGRQVFKHRRLDVCKTGDEARAALAGPGATLVRDRRRAPVVFLFPGQGAQHVGMGRELYESEPVYRDAVDTCAGLLAPHLGLDLRAILHAEADAPAAAEQLRRTELAQPALFVIEYALAQLWMSWGVRPEAMIGHSIGEYVAACLASVLTLEDALRLVAARGRLMGRLPSGAMLAAPLSEEEAARLPGVSVAALNAPDATVISGPAAAVEAAAEALRARGIEGVRLRTSHAFHSEMMDPILDEFRALVASVRRAPPQLPYLSNLTGTWITPADTADPGYWVSHLRRPVRFAAGIAELLTDPDRLLLEVGPGRALTALATRQGNRTAERAFASLGHPRAEASALTSVLEALGHLYLSDVAVDWTAFHAGARRRRVPLPTYPFERQRYARELNAAMLGGATPTAAPGKRERVEEWLYAPSWRRAVAAPLAAEAAGCTLLFATDAPLDHAVAARLAAPGRRVVTVVPAALADLQRLDADRYALDPAAPAQYAALLAALAADGAAPDRVVHLWSLAPVPGVGPERFDAASRLGFSSVLHLVRALGNRAASVGVVTAGVAAVLGDEPLVAENAPLFGLCRVAPQEMPSLACRALDVLVPTDPDAVGPLADRLVAALRAPGDEPVAALRGAHRWVPCWTAAPPPAGVPEVLREGGVYLIVGGTGNVGLSVAAHLARAARAQLVLAGRTGLVPRADWDEWQQTHGPRDKISRRIARVRELEALGAEVLVVSADAGDPEQMADLVARTTARFGALHGVVHAAGSVGPDALRALADTEPRHAEAHLHPRVRGLHALAAALPAGVDFCLLCSSISTALGGVGLGAYASAHGFMDAFATAQNRRGGARWISVGWDAWAPDAAAGDPSPGGPLAALAMRADEGGAALGAILRGGLAEVLVSTVDLAARRDHLQRLQHAQPRDERAEGQTHARPELETPYVAPRTELEAALAEIWQKLFGIDRVGVDDNFFRLGGDSLLAIQLAARLRDAFGLDVPLVDLFEQATVAGLAARIEKLRAEGTGGRVAVESTLAMIEDLSEEEVKKMLAELGQ